MNMQIVRILMGGFAALMMTAMWSVGCIEANASTRQEDDYQRGTVSLDENTLKLVNALLDRYSEWNNVTFNGKIKSDRLPVSPTVKIYAERGRLIQISLRAPFLGEIGRVEVNTDSCLLVNKWKKTYCLESMNNILTMYPDAISDIQSLLLGRVVFPGSGELCMDNIDQVDFRRADGSEWLLLPVRQPGEGQLKYGYVVLDNGRTSAFFAMLEGREENMEIKYTYPGNSMYMDVKVDIGNKEYAARIDYSSVRWGGKPMDEVRLTGYARLGIYDFIKSLR